MDRVWFSLACLPCKRAESGEILTRMNFQFTWINSDTVRIYYRVNGHKMKYFTDRTVTILSPFIKHLFLQRCKNSSNDRK